MARLVTCPACQNKNEKENTICISKRYYCIPCGEKVQEEKKQRSTDWNRLYDYLLELFKVDKVPLVILSQIKRYKEEHNMTDIGIYLTLKYYYETLGNPTYDRPTIGIVEYYYQQAKEHVVRIYELQDVVDNFEFQEETIKVKVGGNSSWSQKKELDLGTIDWEEDIDEDE